MVWYFFPILLRLDSERVSICPMCVRLINNDLYTSIIIFFVSELALVAKFLL